MSRRFEELDSLRGLAASAVVFHHCLLTISIFSAANFHEITASDGFFINLISKTPFHMFWGGHEAVILFFVLSGFVLTLLLNSQKESYSTYLIGRFIRIYIPYIFSIAVSLSLMNLFLDSEHSNLSDWFNGMWSHSISFKEIVSYLFMLGYDSHNVNTVTWSLVHEIRISIIFPVIVYFIYRFDWKISISVGILICLFVYATLNLISKFLITNEVLSFLIQSIGSTVYYCAFFIVGSVLARYKDLLAIFFTKINKKWRILFGISFVGLFTFEWWIPVIGYKKYNGNMIETVSANVIIDYTVMISIIILFLFALNSQRMSSMLKVKPLLFLGKISYSLYLIHPIILLTAINVFENILPTYVILLFVPVLSMISATFMYFLIEKPSIKLGRSLKNRNKKIKIPILKVS